MSMTRGEASRILNYLKAKACSKAERVALSMALTALRGPTGEMVERMRGEWIPAESDFDDDDTLFDVNDWCDWQCSAYRYYACL